MANKFKDFDAMVSDMHEETVPFKAFGKLYNIRKAIPAALVLELARKEKDETLSNEFVFKAARQIFGDAVLSDLCNNPDCTFDKLTKMIQWAFTTINGPEEEEPEEVTEDDVEGTKRKN